MMADRLISEQAVMESLTKEYNQKRTGDGLKLAWIEKAVSATPTAQLAHDLHSARTDLISRQAAIDVLRMDIDIIPYEKAREYARAVIETVFNRLEQLPTAQPVQKTFSVIDNKTGKEADPYEIVLNEDWAKNLMYCDMEGFAILEDGSLILVDECGRHEYCPTERFEVRWDEG